MKQSTTSSSSAGIAVNTEESKAIDDESKAVIEERNVVTDVIAVIETPAEDITLDLDSEELHYLCQETNRPTLGVNWDYLGWVYRSSYSYSSTLPSFILRNKALPCVRAYSSGILLRDTVKRQKVFDTARWKYTRHLMTEEDIHINGKRVAMTEKMMEEVLINELDNMLVITRESRLKLMNDIGQSLKCKDCSETFKLKFLDNLRPELADMLNDYVPCFRCSFQTSRLIILNRRALLIDHKDNAEDNTNDGDGDGDCCESHITSLTSTNSRKRKVTLLDYENDNHINVLRLDVKSRCPDLLRLRRSSP
jgi:hypothetical protein